MKLHLVLRLVILFLCFVGVSGCAYRLRVSNPPFQQKMRLVTSEPTAYTVAIEEGRPRRPQAVASDGSVTLDIPSLSRGCDVYFLDVIKVRSADNPFALKVIHVLRGHDMILQMSLNEMGTLPVDDEGYRLLKLPNRGPTLGRSAVRR